MKLEAAYRKLYNGDSLTDEELIALRAQFKAVYEACIPLGINFRLAYKEAISQYNICNDYCRARGLTSD